MCTQRKNGKNRERNDKKIIRIEKQIFGLTFFKQHSDNILINLSCRYATNI